jgi:hypothetical protein
VSAAAARSDEPGWYLYGVVPAGAPVAAELVTEGRLAGIVKPVALEEFDEAALADAASLERKIREHEQVLERALAETTVLPCRFGAVYRDQGELRRYLAEHEAALADALERLAGRVELGVKAFLHRERSDLASQAESGRAYLEARQQERLAAEEVSHLAGEIAAHLHERLLAVAEDGLRLPPQRPELSGREEPMIFNGAYLVADRPSFERELAARAAHGRESGIELELTGPWPPYNFVPEELGA